MRSTKLVGGWESCTRPVGAMQVRCTVESEFCMWPVFYVQFRIKKDENRFLVFLSGNQALANRLVVNLL